MGKSTKKNLVKGLKKPDRQAVRKMSKSQKSLVKGALKGGAGGAWLAKMVKGLSGPKGATIEEQQRMKQKKNPSGPTQTAAYFLTKNPNAKILLVGEGNFSFARAYINMLGADKGPNITATAFDTRKEMAQKYDDAKENVAAVKASGATVLYGIDGTQLEAHSELTGLYDLIIFNFPHVGLGIKDQDINIATNQDLVGRFLQSGAMICSDQGLICVTTKIGDPYDGWRVPTLGMRVPALRLKNTVSFDPAHFPGYAHRRTAGGKGEDTSLTDNEIISQGAHMFMFTTAEVQESKKKLLGKKSKYQAGIKKQGGFNPKGGSSRGSFAKSNREPR